MQSIVATELLVVLGDQVGVRERHLAFDVAGDAQAPGVALDRVGILEQPRHVRERLAGCADQMRAGEPPLAADEPGDPRDPFGAEPERGAGADERGSPEQDAA